MPNLTLVIGNKNYSSWSLRPWIFLKENEISFNEKRIALFTNTTRDSLSHYNSDFKVPVLIDNEFYIWDSLAILEYMSEKYLNSNGWPKDANARAFARSISCEMHSSFTNVRNELPMNCRKKFQNITLSPAAEHEIDRIKDLWRQSRTQYGKEGPWLFGNYSIADAMYAPIALRFSGYSIPLNSIEDDYIENVLNQPGIIEWIEAGKAETEIIEEDEIKI